VPQVVLDKLHIAIVKAAQLPATQQFYKNFTLTFVGDTPTAFAEFVKADRANATRTFRNMGFKPGSTAAD
jgi:tripartite-type tricarboxylate transporter receptor subunit TctC